MSTATSRTLPPVERVTEGTTAFDQATQSLAAAFSTVSRPSLSYIRSLASKNLAAGGIMFGARETPEGPIVGAVFLSNAAHKASESPIPSCDQIQALQDCFDGGVNALLDYLSTMDTLSGLGVRSGSRELGLGTALVLACLAESKARGHNLALEAGIGPDRRAGSWVSSLVRSVGDIVGLEFSLCRTVGDIAGITTLASHETWYGSVLRYMGHTLGLTESPEEIEAAEKKRDGLLRFYSQPKFDLMCPTTIPDNTGSVYFFSKPLDTNPEPSSVASTACSNPEKNTLGTDGSAD